MSTQKLAFLQNEERPGLSSEEIDEMRQVFSLFDINGTGKIDPQEIKVAIQSICNDPNSKAIFNLIDNIDLEKEGKDGGIDFDTFMNAINDKLGDKESKDSIKQLFDLFVDDTNGKTITINSIKKRVQELGDSITTDELKDIIERVKVNKNELTFEKFYNIMTKKSSN